MFSQWLKVNTKPGQLIDLNYYIPIALNQSIPGIYEQRAEVIYIDQQDFSHTAYSFRYDSSNWLSFKDCNFQNTTIVNSFLRRVEFDNRGGFYPKDNDFFAFRNTTMVDGSLSGLRNLPPVSIINSTFISTDIYGTEYTQVTAYHSKFSNTVWYNESPTLTFSVKLFNSEVSDSNLGCPETWFIFNYSCVLIYAQNNSIIRDSKITQSKLKLNDSVLTNVTLLSSDFNGNNSHLKNSTFSWSLDDTSGNWVVDNSTLIDLHFKSLWRVSSLKISNSNYINGTIATSNIAVSNSTTRNIDFSFGGVIVNGGIPNFTAQHLTDHGGRIHFRSDAENCTFNHTTFIGYNGYTHHLKNTALIGVQFNIPWGSGSVKIESSSLVNSSVDNLDAMVIKSTVSDSYIKSTKANSAQFEQSNITSTTFLGQKLSLNESSMLDGTLTDVDLTTTQHTVMAGTTWRNVKANLLDSFTQPIYLSNGEKNTNRIELKVVNRTTAQLHNTGTALDLVIEDISNSNLEDSQLDNARVLLPQDTKQLTNTSLRRVSLTSSSFFYVKLDGELSLSGDGIYYTKELDDGWFTSAPRNKACSLLLDTNDALNVEDLNLSNSSLAGICVMTNIPFWAWCTLSFSSAKQLGITTDEQTTFREDFCDSYEGRDHFIIEVSVGAIGLFLLLGVLFLINRKMSHQQNQTSLNTIDLSTVDNFKPSALMKEVPAEDILLPRP